MNRSQAIEKFNQFGRDHIPFFFIIDFDMLAIRIFRLDEELPPNIKFNFSDIPSQYSYANSKSRFIIKKKPVTFEEYETAFLKIEENIKAGNSFLANLTFPTPLETNLTLNEIYHYSKARYKVLVDGEFVCFSPESFIRISDGIISTFPMKGTINALIPNAEKLIIENEKETAEHHTVVDLLRNDLSMVATDVLVKRFRYIERLSKPDGQILQVSSEITGKLPPDYYRHLGDLIFKLLPAGSVTGAPKPKTVELIREVEKTKRGYYTGICGVFDGINLDSAVMIRFIELNNGKMKFRSGGGITFMSNANEEYNELIDKVYVPFS